MLKFLNLGDRRNQVLYILSGAAFLVFFQTFMVAPIIPKLSRVFEVSPLTIGLIVPAFLIPYGISTLFYGPLSDWLGRKVILYFCLSGFVLFTAVTALSNSFKALFIFRLLDGIFAGGTVPIALAVVSDLFKYNERGRAIGWLFGAMAGGMAFGATFGVIIEPLITWRMLFLAVAILIAGVFYALTRYGSLLKQQTGKPGRQAVLKNSIVDYAGLLQSARGFRTYIYVFLNGMIHSGIYTWLGYLFSTRYHLGEVGIGLSLLGYGIPGFIFGPAIGRLADRWGRKILIPVGLLIAATASYFLSLPFPIIIAPLIVSYLSLGYDMTQPLLAGIVTDLSPKKGLAIGMMAFFLFLGFGTGSYVFGRVMAHAGLNLTFFSFAVFSIALSVMALPLFREEGRPKDRR